MRFRETILAHNVESDDLTNSEGGRKRTDDVQIAENVGFSDLMIKEEILMGLKKSGFKKPSPIQLKAIPVSKLGMDLIVQAKSGTGKTLVFVVNALETIQTDNPATQVIVLAPTREIAQQIFTCFKRIGQKMIENGLTVRCFIGGVDVRQDIRCLRHPKGCQVIVGSPGRLCQLIQESHISLGSVRLLILDEADKMMEEPFQQNVNWIFSQMPASKQVTVYSATYPDELDAFLSRYMDCPTMIKLDGGDVQLLGIKQYRSMISEDKAGLGDCAPKERGEKIFLAKVDRLEALLKRVSYSQAMVFCNYQDKAQEVADLLTERDISAVAISAKLEQQERMEIVRKLKSFRVRLLVSTDLTARGIDAPNVNLVINLEVPLDTETYFHRIGRAGRYGGYGAAITIVIPSVDNNRFKAIGSGGQFRVMELADPETESIPPDLSSNMEYWKAQFPVEFPAFKPRSKINRMTNGVGSTENGGAFFGKKAGKGKKAWKRTTANGVGGSSTVDSERISPENIPPGSFETERSEVGSESGIICVYSREEMMELNSRINSDLTENGCESEELKETVAPSSSKSVFDPIDDLEDWDRPDDSGATSLIAGKKSERNGEQSGESEKENSVFEPIDDGLEYWERPNSVVKKSLAGNPVGKQEKSAEIKKGALSIEEFGIPLEKQRTEPRSINKTDNPYAESATPFEEFRRLKELVQSGSGEESGPSTSSETKSGLSHPGRKQLIAKRRSGRMAAKFPAMSGDGATETGETVSESKIKEVAAYSALSEGQRSAVTSEGLPICEPQEPRIYDRNELLKLRDSVSKEDQVRLVREKFSDEKEKVFTAKEVLALDPKTRHPRYMTESTGSAFSFEKLAELRSKKTAKNSSEKGQKFVKDQFPSERDKEMEVNRGSVADPSPSGSQTSSDHSIFRYKREEFLALKTAGEESNEASTFGEISRNIASVTQESGEKPVSGSPESIFEISMTPTNLLPEMEHDGVKSDGLGCVSDPTVPDTVTQAVHYSYSRQELMDICFRGPIPEHQLRAYAESTWNFEEEPFVKDPMMRCPYSQQLRVTRARETALRTNSGVQGSVAGAKMAGRSEQDRWPRGQRAIEDKRGEWSRELPPRKVISEERETELKVEKESIEQLRRERAERRMEMLANLGDLGSVEPRKVEGDAEERRKEMTLIMDYDTLCAELRELIEKEEKDDNKLGTGAAVFGRQSPDSWEAEVEKTSKILDEIYGKSPAPLTENSAEKQSEAVLAEMNAAVFRENPENEALRQEAQTAMAYRMLSAEDTEDLNKNEPASKADGLIQPQGQKTAASEECSTQSERNLNSASNREAAELSAAQFASKTIGNWAGFRPVAYTVEDMLNIWNEMEMSKEPKLEPWYPLLEESGILVERSHGDEEMMERGDVDMKNNGVGDEGWAEDDYDTEESEDCQESDDSQDQSCTCCRDCAANKQEIQEYITELNDWYERVAGSTSNDHRFLMKQEYLNLMRAEE